MPMIPEILIPLIFKLGLKHWRDTWVVILPPNYSAQFVSTSPKGKAILNYYIKISKPRIYNPTTGEIGDVIISDDVGGYRMSTLDKWHRFPFVESVYDEGLGDFTITGENQYECTYMMYNYTSYYVFFTVTTFIFEFPVEYVDEIKKYFRGIAEFFLSQAEKSQRGEYG